MQENAARQQPLARELKASAEWEKSKARVQAGLVATISGELAAQKKACESAAKRTEKKKVTVAKMPRVLRVAKDIAVTEAVSPLRQKLVVVEN